MSYAGRVGQVSTDFPNQGGSMTVGDPFTYCPSVWDYVIARFSISSGLDVAAARPMPRSTFIGRGCRRQRWKVSGRASISRFVPRFTMTLT